MWFRCLAYKKRNKPTHTPNTKKNHLHPELAWTHTSTLCTLGRLFGIARRDKHANGATEPELISIFFSFRLLLHPFPAARVAKSKPWMCLQTSWLPPDLLLRLLSRWQVVHPSSSSTSSSSATTNHKSAVMIIVDESEPVGGKSSIDQITQPNVKLLTLSSFWQRLSHRSSREMSKFDAVSMCGISSKWRRKLAGTV